MAERNATALWDNDIVKGRAGRFDAQVRPAHPGAQSGDVRGRSDGAGGDYHPLQAISSRVTSTLVGFELQIALWLWFTVGFANFAEAMAEGRGKAQADNLRKTRTETQARQIKQGQEIMVPATSLRRDDIVMVKAGEVIPGDGEVIEGVAAVNEAAITGESAPVIRESGGDRSAVTGGTTVISDWIKVRITANPGETFLDRMIALVEGAQRQKTPNEIALSILLAGLTIIFMLVCVSLYPFALYGGTVLTLPVLVALAGLPDSDDHRRPALRHRHRRDGSAGAAQRARDVGPRGRGRGRRRYAAARQNRHDHAWQPDGDRIPPGARRSG